MATLTVRNLPDLLAKRLKQRASEHNCSMEQEVRNILQETLESRSDLLCRLAERSTHLPAATSTEIDGWIADGRSRNGA